MPLLKIHFLTNTIGCNTWPKNKLQLHIGMSKIRSELKLVHGTAYIIKAQLLCLEIVIYQY